MSKAAHHSIFRLTLAAAALSLVAPSAAQQIPVLAQLSSAAARAHPELVSERTVLGSDRNELRERVKSHNRQCSAVETDSAADLECRNERDALRAEMDAHIRWTNQYNAAVANAEAMAPAGAQGNAVTFAPSVSRVEVAGEFSFTLPDGRQLKGEDASSLALAPGTRLRTGSGSNVRVILPDGAVLRLGPNTTLQVEQFDCSSMPGSCAVFTALQRGLARWAKQMSAENKHQDVRMNLGSVLVAARGTDFEATVGADNGGEVVLHSGQLEITEKATGRVLLLNGGKSLRFSADGIASHP